MTTDPLEKQLMELAKAQERVHEAIVQLEMCFQAFGCVRDHLIAELRAAHIEQYKLIGIE